MTGEKVLVLGGGVGGLVASSILKGKLGREVKVQLIERKKEFQFPPSYPWLMLGMRKPEQVQRSLSSLIDVLPLLPLNQNPLSSSMLSSAMQKIESAIIAVVLGLAIPFIITFLVSGGQTSSFLLPCDNLNAGVCTVGTISGNTISLPAILVDTANLVITLLAGILIMFASIFGIWGAIEYLGARGSSRGGV
ncbi:MAG: hypothetical protein HY296_03565 [Thaumarchaeota archaeon]|nr:hypothetical protein [Nitrososphaerota archaeon]